MSTVSADTIVFGAKVTTLDDDDSDVTTAFVVRGERSLAVGAEAEVMRPGHRRCGTPPLSATATDMHC
jgi:predicted amidohydrolase YtcJ